MLIKMIENNKTRVVIFTVGSILQQMYAKLFPFFNTSYVTVSGLGTVQSSSKKPSDLLMQ